MDDADGDDDFDFSRILTPFQGLNLAFFRQFLPIAKHCPFLDLLFGPPTGTFFPPKFLRRSGPSQKQKALQDFQYQQSGLILAFPLPHHMVGAIPWGSFPDRPGRIPQRIDCPPCCACTAHMGRCAATPPFPWFGPQDAAAQHHETSLELGSHTIAFR